MRVQPVEGQRLLNRIEVARMFRVAPKTVTRWGKEGRLSTVMTPGGIQRFIEDEVLALLQDDCVEAVEGVESVEAIEGVEGVEAVEAR
jgi:hypothetical protein